MFLRFIKNLYSLTFAPILLSLFILVACKSSQELQVFNPEVEKNIVPGYIKDTITGKPISNVWIHVRETAITSVSDSIGRFNLYNIPNGKYQVLFTSSGIEDSLVTIDLTGKSEKKLTINLERISQFKRAENNTIMTPVKEYDRLIRSINEMKYQIQEIKNEIHQLSQSLVNIEESGKKPANETDKCQRLLSEYFIGSNRYPGCKLINSEMVNFERCDESVDSIKLKTPVTLKVLNRYLGYYLNLNVEYLELKRDQLGYQINYRGNTYFTEIFSDLANNEDLLRQRRNEVFKGSFKHFLIAASKRTPMYRYGFELYSGQFLEGATSLGSNFSKVEDIKISIKDIVKTTDDPEIKQLLFDGEVRVVYTFRRVSDKKDFAGVKKGDFPRSWLRLRSPRALFTTSGTLLDKNSIQFSGYWNSQSVCEMLPEDYVPDI